MDETIIKMLSFVIGQLPESCKVRQKVVLSNKGMIKPANQTVIFIVRPDIDVIK
jgi:hypothetical protein